jgi:hypothetical protein
MSHGDLPPPPPSYGHNIQQGPFDDAVIMSGPYDDSDNDRRGNSNMDMFDDLFQPSGNNKNKKNGNKTLIDPNKKPVAVKYEGYTIEPKKTADGGYTYQGSSIQRMPFEQSDILALSARHKGTLSASQVNDSYKRCGDHLRGAILKKLDALIDNETQKNAGWTIYDINKEFSTKPRLLGLSSERVCRRVEVIYKRADKTSGNSKAVVVGSSKDGVMKTGKTGTGKDKIVAVYDDDVPVKKNKNKGTQSNQKLKRSNSYSDLPDPMEMLGLGGFDSPPKRHARQNNNNFNDNNYHHQNNNNWNNNQQEYYPPAPPNHVPHGAIPVNQNMPPPNFNQQPFYSARRANEDVPPFTPFHGVPGPVDMPSPEFHEPNWPHPHGHGHGVRRAQSLSRGHSNRRSRTDAALANLEDRIEDLTLAVVESRNDRDRDRDYRDRNRERGFDSDDSYYGEEGDTIFSRPLSPTRSWTPPSSPRSHFSEMRAQRSLERRQSKKYRPHYRSRHSSAVDVIPGYSGNGGYRPRSEDYGRPRKRYEMHRSITYDDRDRERDRDYPVRAPEPPTRRFSEYDRDREWERRSYRDDGRRGSRYEDDERRREYYG